MSAIPIFSPVDIHWTSIQSAASPNSIDPFGRLSQVRLHLPTTDDEGGKQLSIRSISSLSIRRSYTTFTCWTEHVRDHTVVREVATCSTTHPHPRPRPIHISASLVTCAKDVSRSGHTLRIHPQTHCLGLPRGWLAASTAERTIPSQPQGYCSTWTHGDWGQR